MKEGVAMHDSLNAVEQLMGVHARTADKQAVFEEFKQKYATHFAQNEAYEKQKQEITQAIVNNAQGLNAAIAQVGNDTAKNQYFQQINEAIIVQE